MSKDSYNSPARKKLSTTESSESPGKDSPFKRSFAPEIRLRLRGNANQSLVNLKNSKNIPRNKSSKQLSHSFKFTEEMKNNLEKTSEALTGDKFEVYQLTFAKLMNNEPRLFSLLSKIKRGYEEHISKLQTENFKMKHEIDKLQSRMNSEKKEIKKLNKKFNVLVLKNTEFDHFLDELNRKLNIQPEFSVSEGTSDQFKKAHAKVILKLSNCLKEIKEMKAREGQFNKLFDPVNHKRSPETELFNTINLEENQDALSEITLSFDSSYISPVKYKQSDMDPNSVYPPGTLI